MNQFSRLELLVGNDNLEKIKNKKVLILGVGGVGSFVLEGLIRSGISDIVIIDYDKVDITNLNRQLMTNLNNIGKKKVDVLFDRIKSINPDCKVTIISEKIMPGNIDLLFDSNPDYIIDCCDTVLTKKSVIENCLRRKIKFITCMGMGNKINPQGIEIVDIRKTSYDPLAKKIRKWVNDENIKGKVLCCYSKEKPLENNSGVIGSSMFVPSTAGILIASYVISDIIKR